MRRSTKTEVLRILRSAGGEPVSGEVLASEIGVSRNSIWKAVTALKDEGYEIEGRQKRGYVLSESDVLSADEIKRYLNNPHCSSKIIIYDTVDSTNNAAKRYAAENSGGDVFDRVFIAKEQTAGKGRLGRSFYSPLGSGLYISFLLRPGIMTESAVMLTTAASVAVCEAIAAAIGEKTEIKWVNDVYCRGKKICGILTEAVSDIESGSVESVVIGIGVNISTTDFPDDLGKVAGSLDSTDADIRSRLAAEIINQIDKIVCGEILEHGDYGYIKKYKERSMVLGKDIRIVNTDESAHVIDIDERGGLVVETESGIRTISTGEISIRLK